MRPLKLIAALVLGAPATLVPAMPAQAGGWALTFIDPMDERTTCCSTQYVIEYVVAGCMACPR